MFIKQKKELLEILDRKSLIVHRGASGLGISGKGELDIYVPVSLEHFDSILKLLINAYGKPGSLYPEERARFNRKIEDIPVEIFLINREGEGMGWRK